MTKNYEVIDEYFEWLLGLVCYAGDRNCWRQLFQHLHSAEFTYINPMDKNRALDGVDLRERFAYVSNYDDLSMYLTGPCSVLEMMIALAMKCEEHIMDDPEIGNRLGQWFWDMIDNLGLKSMTNRYYNKNHVDHVISNFLSREYDKNGKGGLFTVKDYNGDLRKIEIWYQMCWYLDTIL